MKLPSILIFAASMAALQAIAQDKPATTATPVSAATASVDASGSKPATAIPEMPDPKKISYSIGMNVGQNLKQRFPEADIDSIVAAIKDVLAGNKTQLTEDEAREIISEFSRVSMAREAEKARVAAEKNKVEGEAFLAKNTKEPGVITLPSGLQYIIITEGTGATPKSNEVVTANYRGTLIDGTEFDSSFAPGRKPFMGSVSAAALKGWTEIFQKMKVGSKYKVFLPPSLAFGPSGRRPKIEGNSVVIFELELLAITEQKAPADQGIVGDIIKVPSQEEMKKGAKVEGIKLPPTNAPVQAK
jgi:FKBP-type peptidyl-prolyl cis-trans isomerase